MRVHPINSIEGSYWYLIATIVLLSVAFGVYLGGVELGIVPDFADIFP